MRMEKLSCIKFIFWKSSSHSLHDLSCRSYETNVRHEPFQRFSIGKRLKVSKASNYKSDITINRDENGNNNILIQKYYFFWHNTSNKDKSAVRSKSKLNPLLHLVYQK